MGSLGVLHPAILSQSEACHIHGPLSTPAVHGQRPDSMATRGVVACFRSKNKQTMDLVGLLKRLLPLAETKTLEDGTNQDQTPIAL